MLFGNKRFCECACKQARVVISLSLSCAHVLSVFFIETTTMSKTTQRPKRKDAKLNQKLTRASACDAKVVSLQNQMFTSDELYFSVNAVMQAKKRSQKATLLLLDISLFDASSTSSHVCVSSFLPSSKHQKRANKNVSR